MEDFIKQLLQQKGIPADMDEEDLQHVVDELQARAMQLINKRLIEALPDQAVDELNALIDSGHADEQAIQNFISSHVPDVQSVTTNALVEFRDLYLANPYQD